MVFACYASSNSFYIIAIWQVYRVFLSTPDSICSSRGPLSSTIISAGSEVDVLFQMHRVCGCWRFSSEPWQTWEDRWFLQWWLLLRQDTEHAEFTSTNCSWETQEVRVIPREDQKSQINQTVCMIRLVGALKHRRHATMTALKLDIWEENCISF